MGDVMDLSPFSRVAAAHAARPQPEALFSALDRAVADTLGYRLFTVLAHDAAGGRMRRVHSSRPDIHPVGGSKPVTDSDWMSQVLVRGEPYIGRTLDDLRVVFFDHEILAAIGCGSVLNMPVVWSGTVLGSLNILHEAGWYDETHVPVARVLAQLSVPALMPMAQGSSPKRA